jgi:hypothetical protein
VEERGELAEAVTVERAAGTLFAVAANESVYLRLVDECGWTDSDYARWLERLLGGLLSGSRATSSA